jgi:hypothetical protein
MEVLTTEALQPCRVEGVEGMVPFAGATLRDLEDCSKRVTVSTSLNSLTMPFLVTLKEMSTAQLLIK